MKLKERTPEARAAYQQGCAMGTELTKKLMLASVDRQERLIEEVSNAHVNREQGYKALGKTLMLAVIRREIAAITIPYFPEEDKVE